MISSHLQTSLEMMLIFQEKLKQSKTDADTIHLAKTGSNANLISLIGFNYQLKLQNMFLFILCTFAHIGSVK